MATTAGFKGIRVDSSDQLEGALRDAFAHPGPALIDVVTATQELSMPPAIGIEQAKGFSAVRGAAGVARGSTIPPAEIVNPK